MRTARIGRPVVDCLASGDAGKSMTRQSETASTDINAAVRKYRKSGALTGPLAATRKAVFGDFADSPQDYLHAQTQIVNARCAFAGLPARVRERFGNDPVALLTFLADPANQAEAVALGLAEASKAEAPKEPAPQEPELKP